MVHFLLGAAGLLFVAMVLLGCFILAVTSLNGYTLLLLLAVFGLGRLTKQNRRIKR